MKNVLKLITISAVALILLTGAIGINRGNPVYKSRGKNAQMIELWNRISYGQNIIDWEMMEKNSGVRLELKK